MSCWTSSSVFFSVTVVFLSRPWVLLIHLIVLVQDQLHDEWKAKKRQYCKRSVSIKLFGSSVTLPHVLQSVSIKLIGVSVTLPHVLESVSIQLIGPPCHSTTCTVTSQHQTDWSTMSLYHMYCNQSASNWFTCHITLPNALSNSLWRNISVLTLLIP